MCCTGAAVRCYEKDADFLGGDDRQEKMRLADRWIFASGIQTPLLCSCSWLPVAAADNSFPKFVNRFLECQCSCFLLPKRERERPNKLRILSLPSFLSLCMHGCSFHLFCLKLSICRIDWTCLYLCEQSCGSSKKYTLTGAK